MQGWRCTVVTSDRDAFALIDATTSVLRVITGGIEASPVLTPGRMPMLYGIEAAQYRDYAALRGDSSDNLPGAVGIGAKTAAKLLASFATVADAYRAIDEGREAEVVAVVGPAATRRLADPVSRANVERNQRLMALRDDLELPDHATMRVPMDLLRVQSVLRERDIHLGPSLWALTGSAPPGADRWASMAEQDDVAPVPAHLADQLGATLVDAPATRPVRARPRSSSTTPRSSSACSERREVREDVRDRVQDGRVPGSRQDGRTRQRTAGRGRSRG